MLLQAWDIMFKPTSFWKKIGDTSEKDLSRYILYPVILALIPSLAWYYGTTAVGWTVAGDSLTRLTTHSAAVIAVCLFLAQIVGIWVIGFFIHWMSQTYDADTSIVKGAVIAGFTATPLLLAGAIGIYPHLAFDLLVAILAASYSVYLLYIGIPLVMHMPPERGFLYASAIVGVVLVLVISMMGATLILWDLGLEPVFID